jgi:hypothetical protein
MVKKRERTRADVIEELARAPLTGSPLPVPFVLLPDGIKNLDDLMDFDRLMCQRHSQFRRPFHPADAPFAVTSRGATVTVTAVSPGIRTRVVCEAPQVTRRS